MSVGSMLTRILTGLFHTQVLLWISTWLLPHTGVEFCLLNSFFCLDSLYPTNLSGLSGVHEQGERECRDLPWPSGFWEDNYREQALRSARCYHPHQPKRPHPEWPGPRAAAWTACVVIPALGKRPPAKPRGSCSQVTAFPSGTGKEDAGWHMLTAASGTLL